MNRRGDWIQVFLMLFFFLILFVALALLFVEKDTLETTRAENTEDLADAKAAATLISLLRQPVMIDMNDDTKEEQVTIAVALTRGGNNARVKEVLDATLGTAGVYVLTHNGTDIANIKDEWIPSPRRLNPYPLVKNEAPKASATLPDGTTVTLAYADVTTLARIMPNWDAKIREELLLKVLEARS